VQPFGKGKGWYPSYVQKILANEAVIGRFQPGHHVWVDGKVKREKDGDPIEGYYPAILDPDDFYRVLRSKPGVSGRKGKALTNTLRGLALCFKCGGVMHYVSKAPKGRPYLACDNARRKHKCDAKSVKYITVLNSVMNSLEVGELDLRQILSNGEADKRQEIVHRIEAIGGQIDEIEKSNINLLDVLSRQPSPAIEERLAENESKLTQLRHEMADLEAETHNLKYGQDHLGAALQAWGDVRRTVQHGTDEEAGEMRVRLNAALKRLIKSIEIGKVSEFESDVPLWENFKSWQDPLGEAIPITVNFQADRRHLLIYAYPKDLSRWLAIGVKVQDGKIEQLRLSGDPVTQSRPEYQEMFSPA